MRAASPDRSWADERLIESCLEGSDLAWQALVDKYQKLVYAVILTYRPDPDAASDLFQAVWLDVFNDLENVRNRETLKPWLLTLTRHKCFHWKRRQSRIRDHEITPAPGEDGSGGDGLEREPAIDPSFDERLMRDQLVREAIAALPQRCRRMIHLLFFARPPLPYREVAQRLGLATGSIGFIRGRCLKKLQAALEELDAG